MPTQAAQQVFEPDAVPKRRKTPNRKLTFRCCLKTFAVLGAALGIVLLVLIGKALYGSSLKITAAHSDMPHFTGIGVRPLVNATAKFDVLATVWLDVTQHLAKGGVLSDDTQVVTYRSWDGTERKEAILYSELLFKDATMASKLHATARIRLPIEPLYTQSLGPASLRGTFKLVARSLPVGLAFNSSTHVYPSHLPIGPRSPTSSMLRTNVTEEGAQAPFTLEEALEHSAISTNLLTLLSTEWQLQNETHRHLRGDSGVDSPMFDGSPSNRAFAVEKGNLSQYIADRSHRILLPHVCTRSRVMLIREERTLPIYDYYQRFGKSLKKLAVDCIELHKANGTKFTSNGQCQRLLQDSPFENRLQFHNRTNVEQVYPFYAPFLAQQTSAAAHRHHRTIPNTPPNKPSSSPTAAKTKEDNCLIPLLQMDASAQYFEFDWDVLFSAHVHLRSMIAESFSQHSEPLLEKLLESNTTQLRIRLSEGESAIWALQSECCCIASRLVLAVLRVPFC
jgi:hypothetical protein